MQYAATLSAPFVDPRARLRRHLHLLMALAMLWTNTAPVISLAMSNASQPRYSQDWPVQPRDRDRRWPEYARPLLAWACACGCAGAAGAGQRGARD